jgi:hypothetical protein
MKVEIGMWMMIFFIIFMIIGMWKIYAFLPNKKLADDDTTKESQQELLKLMLQVIKASDGKINSADLYKKMKENESFDKNHFWRFNQNRLNQLLQRYLLQNPHLNKRGQNEFEDANIIEDIYRHLREE